MSFPFGASSEKMDFLSLQLKGNASTLKTPDGVVLRLTPAKHNQIGTAFTNNKLNIAAGFSTFFTFRITKPIYIKGGDGIVFVVQSEQSNVLIEGESDIGYAKILKSVGVEFDTWNNTAWRNDYDDNHLGINIKGDFNGPTASVAPSFNDEKIWYAWIDYDGKQLAVRTNQTGKPPEEPLLTRSLNLQEILGDTQAFVGFTSSTGGDYNNHDIVSWKFTPSYLRGNITYSPKPAILEGDSVTFKALVTETNMGVSSADASWTVKTRSGETLSISEKTATLRYSFGKVDTYVVEADIEGHSIGQATILVRQMVTLTFSVPEKTSVAADIAFVLDQSYSHKDDIVIFQTKAEQIVSVFDTFGESVYYALTGFIDYSDYPYGKKGDFPYRLYQTLTDDKERFISEIKKLVIYNGGDNLESQLEAVYRTVNELKWRTGSLKIILLATDANFHDRDQKLSSPENREREKDPSYPGRGYLETLSALQKNHITVYGLGGTGRMDDLLKLSEDSGGIAYCLSAGKDRMDDLLKLSEDSSGIAYCLSVGKEQITEHISKILETLKTSGYLVLKTDNPRYVESIRPKTIDLAGLSAGDQVQFTVIFNPDTLRNEQAEFSFFLQTDKGAVLEERPFD